METRRQFSRIGWAFVVFFLVDIGIQLLMGVGLGLWIAYGGKGMPDVDYLMLAQASMYLCAFPIFWLMIRRVPSWKKKDGETISIGAFLLWAVVCFGFTYIGNLAGQIMMGAVETVIGSVPENPVLDLIDEMNPWTVFFSTAVIAPVMEEIMFRKILIDRIVPFGQRAAVVVSGVAFGLFHGNFYQFFYACILGMMFAYLYSSTGKIRYTILLHMMINLTGGVVPVVLLQGMDGFSAATVFTLLGIVLLGLLMIGSIIGAIVLTCIYSWRLPWFHGWAPIPKKGFWRTVLTAPGVVAFLVICVVMFMLN